MLYIFRYLYIKLIVLNFMFIYSNKIIIVCFLNYLATFYIDLVIHNLISILINLLLITGT